MTPSPGRRNPRHPLTVGERIRKMREAKRLTQAELAQLVGVTVGQASRWERDEAEPKIANLRALKRALETTYEELIGD